MPQTYETIATTLLTSTSTGITFDRIPSIYDHLILQAHASNTASIPNMFLRFNGDTGSNYSSQYWYPDGSGTIQSGRSTNSTSMVLPAVGLTTNRSGVKIDIGGCFNANMNTGAVFTSQVSPGNGFFICAGTWRSTATVYKIDIIPSANSWSIDSLFTLYGIKGA